MFGQPQQPQPAQPRQTLMTPMTAGQRYRQMLQQNVPQAQAVASGLAQIISTPEEEAQRKLAAAQQEFQQRITDSGLKRDEEATKKIFERVAQLQAGQEISPEDFAELQRIIQTRETFGEGTRPEDFLSLENYLQAVSQAQQAQEMARLTGETGTRQTLLQQLVRRPEYTSGQALFDALLAGGTAPAAQTIQDVRSRLLEQDVLGKAEQQTFADLQAARTAQQEEIDSAYEDIQKFLDGDEGALSGLESSIRDRVKAETTRAKELNADIDKLLQPEVDGKPNTVIGDTKEEQEIIKRLGLLDEQVQGLNSVSPGLRTNLIERLKENITEQTVTSPEELARLNALYKIAGITGREAPRLAVAEGEDLGTLAKQRINIDREEGKRQTEQTEKLVTAARNEIGEIARSSERVEDYKYGKNMSLNSAVKDIYARIVSPKYNASISRTNLGAFDAVQKGNAKPVIKSLEKLNKEYAEKLKSLNRIEAESLRTTPSDQEVMEQLKTIAKNQYRYGQPDKLAIKLGNGEISWEEFKKQSTYQPKYFDNLMSYAKEAAKIKLLSDNIGLKV